MGRRRSLLARWSAQVSLFSFAAALINPAFAQAPVAIVEDVSSGPLGVSIMDYLEAGRTIDLGADGSLLLSYLNSCVRETIRGGVVMIGREQSEIRSGHVERARVDCDAANMMAAPGRSVDLAGMIARDETPGKGLPRVEPAQAPEFVLYGKSPFIELSGEGPLVIARLDEKGEYLKMPIERGRLLQGRFLDLAEQGQSLTAGGIYGARWNKRLIVFKIDPNARAGKTPILGRLLRLSSAP